MAVQPRVSSFWVTVAILCAIGFTFYGCSLIATDGRGYSGRGPWEFTAVGLLFAAGLLIFTCYRLAFKSGPSFTIHQDRIEHYAWKKPIFLDDIEEVVFEPGNLWMRRADTAYLKLTNGSIQYIPTLLMTSGPEGFAATIKDALERHRAGTAPTVTAP
jgi:hypothetical protein